MKIFLCDTSPALAGHWFSVLATFPHLTSQVVIKIGSIFETKADAVVSPANSFGFMDGGIDALYVERFGKAIQDEVQREIRHGFNGELLVGEALIVPTGNEDQPFLIAAPTMRVPMTILHPNDVRIATRAAVALAKRSKCESIAMPGMGTGTGKVRHDWAASLMIAGINDALNPKPFPETLRDAAIDHYTPYLDGTVDKIR